MIAGIDPGMSGGVAIMGEDGQIVFKGVMPIRHKLLDCDALVKILKSNKVKIAWLERAHAFPKQGVSSSFNYGRHFGTIEGVLHTCRIPITLIIPKVWTSDIHEGLDPMLPAKEKSAIAISRMYPGIDFRSSSRCRKPHDGIMDAVLIAEHGRRKIFGLCDTIAISSKGI